MSLECKTLIGLCQSRDRLVQQLSEAERGEFEANGGRVSRIYNWAFLSREKVLDLSEESARIQELANRYLNRWSLLLNEEEMKQAKDIIATLRIFDFCLDKLKRLHHIEVSPEKKGFFQGIREVVSPILDLRNPNATFSRLLTGRYAGIEDLCARLPFSFVKEKYDEEGPGNHCFHSFGVPFAQPEDLEKYGLEPEIEGAALERIDHQR